jgi:hypothetical protein
LFKFVPSRPEECGMYWLVRRKDFDVKSWRPPCKYHRCAILDASTQQKITVRITLSDAKSALVWILTLILLA